METNADQSLPVILHPVSGTVSTQNSSIAVRYESQGCILVLANSHQAIEVALQLKDRHKVVVLLMEAVTVGDLPGDLHCLRAEILELSGYLGRFQVRIQGKQGSLNPAILCPGEKGCFDLVLDFLEPPYLQMEIPPLGYYTVRNDPQALHRALIEIDQLNGSFYKQKFYSYNASKCAHGRSGIQGCRRCIDVCPTEAIVSNGNKVSVDPYLCQGCGNCATACPSAAIVYSFQTQEWLLEHLRLSLKATLAAGHSKPCVLFHDDQQGKIIIDKATPSLSPRILTIALYGIASVGLEIWFATLAYGAAEIIVLGTASVSKRAVEEWRRQLDNSGRLLEALGYSSQCIRLIEVKTEHDLLHALDTEFSCLPRTAAQFSFSKGKRHTFEQALEYLLTGVPVPQEPVQLNSSSLFGNVCVNPEACTLCMGCVKVCPSRALQRCGENAAPKLGFVESLCLQCGLCTAACPEDAIRLSPRLDFDLEGRTRMRVLHESPAFRCILCGKPFSTQAIINLMSERLRDNPFFQGDGIKKLQMCPDCRSQSNIAEALQRLPPIQKE